MGLETRSHDEMDAITSAIVGRYFEVGLFEPMGIPSEAQLIVPKVRPLVFREKPVICLAGKTGAGNPWWLAISASSTDSSGSAPGTLSENS